MTNLFHAAHQCLMEPDLQAKLAGAGRMWADWMAGSLQLQPLALSGVVEPGRPQRPVLVPPREVPRRRLGSREGQAAMIHAIAHIEFNAINLACDAVCRFQSMPPAYYDDWVRVAAEEAKHFGLLQERLAALGFAYGDFPAHDGLWQLALETAHDPMARMALVPRVMEARGLDVTPAIIGRFQAIGDEATIAVLEVILREEVGHVAAGSRWFRYLCAQRGLEPETTFFSLLAEAFPEGVRCPLHREARQAAGFSHTELERLEELCVRH